MRRAIAVGRFIITGTGCLLAAGALIGAGHAHADPDAEQQFLRAINGAHVHMYDLPGPRDASPAALIADGYHVCAVMDQYPTDLGRVYQVLWPDGTDLANPPEGRTAWLGYSAHYLCPQHAAVWS